MTPTIGSVYEGGQAEMLERLQALPPAVRLADGRMLLARAEVALAAFKDPASRSEFPSRRFVTKGLRGSRADSVARALLSRDPPAHTELRSAAAPLYGARAIAPSVQHGVNVVCNRLAERVHDSPARVALLHDALADLPYLINGRVVGVDQALLDEALPHIHTIEAASRNPDPHIQRQGDFAADTLRRLVAHALAGECHEDTVLGRLQRLSRRSCDLDQLDFVDNAKAMLFAGAEETQALLAGTLYRALAGVATPPRAITEVLRDQPPIRHALRYLAEDLLVGSLCIPAGNVVLIPLALLTSVRSSLGDVSKPIKEEDEDTGWRRAYGFGRHRCLGMHLAQQAVETTTDRVLRMLNGHVREVEPVPLYSGPVQGLADVVVCLQHVIGTVAQESP